MMREIIHIETHHREVLVDITPQVESVLQRSGIQNGLVSVYAQGATAAIMIQENWDDSVQTDVVNLLAKMIPRGVWLHDAQDGNGDSHLKSGLVIANNRAHHAPIVARTIEFAKEHVLPGRQTQLAVDQRDGFRRADQTGLQV